MANENSTKRDLADGKGSEKAKGERVARDYRQFDMAGIVAEQVRQYQILLTQQIEDEVRHKVLVQVEERGRALRDRTQEYLKALEVQIQRGMELVMARARDVIFRMVNEEMERVFEQLEGNLRGLVDTALDAQVVAEKPSQELDRKPEGIADVSLEALAHAVTRAFTIDNITEKEPVQPIQEGKGRGTGVTGSGSL